MAVAIDVVGTKQTSTSTVQTFGYTGLTTGASLSNGAIIATLVFSNNSVTGVTASWGGQAMTSLIGPIGGNPGTCYLFGLAGLSNFGNQTLTVNWATSNAEVWVDALSFTGVNQTTPFTNSNSATGTGTAPSVTITSTVGDYTVGVLAANSFPPNMNSVNNTQLYIDNTSFAQGANYSAGAATVTLSGILSSSSAWAAIGVDVQAAGGGTGTDYQAFVSSIVPITLW